MRQPCALCWVMLRLTNRGSLPIATLLVLIGCGGETGQEPPAPPLACVAGGSGETCEGQSGTEPPQPPGACVLAATSVVTDLATPAEGISYAPADAIAHLATAWSGSFIADGQRIPAKI